MELKDYLAILWHRWYLVLLVPALVLVGVVVQATQTKPSYTATARVAVTHAPEVEPPQPDYFRYDDYYTYLASEYLIDDLVEVVRGNVFAADVAKTIDETTGIQVSPGEIQGAISSDRLNRILSIHVTLPDANRATLIAQAAATTLESNAASFFGPGSPATPAIVTAVQIPEGAASNLNRQRFIQAVQVLMALFAGVLLAFLVNYLDDTLRSPEMVSAALRVPVIGTIPDGKER